MGLLTGSNLMGCKKPYENPRYSTPNPNLPLQYSPIPGVAQSFPHIVTKELRCNKPGTKEEYELCQPWRQAEAAEEAACVSRIQLVLGVFGFGLLWLTFRANAVAARGAERAAIAAEEALTDLERPHVYMTVAEASFTKQTDGNGQPIFRPERESRFVYAFINLGRTPAQLTDIILKYPIVRKADKTPPPLAHDTKPDRHFPIGTVSAPDHPHEEGVQLSHAWGNDIFAEASAPANKILFFQGRISYTDIFQEKYVSGFCFQFDPLGQQFVRWGDTAYNYTYKKEQPQPSWRRPIGRLFGRVRAAAHGRALPRITPS